MFTSVFSAFSSVLSGFNMAEHIKPANTAISLWDYLSLAATSQSVGTDMVVYSTMFYNFIQFMISVYYFTLTIMFEPKDFGYDHVFTLLAYSFFGFSSAGWLLFEAIPRWVAMGRDDDTTSEKIWGNLEMLLELILGSGSSVTFWMYIKE